MNVDPLRFYSEQLARSAKGLQLATSTRNAQLASLNAKQSFKHNFMCGLILWRSKQNPTQHLRAAVQGLTGAISLFEEWNEAANLVEALPVGTAAIVAKLVGVEWATHIVSPESQAVENQLDLLLVSERQEGSKVRDLIAKLQASKRTQLAAESYANYFDLLEGKNTDVSVKHGELLFAKRRTDSYYSGGDQYEGGGPDNSLVVDYRLAVALILANARSSSLHAWQWPRGNDAV